MLGGIHRKNHSTFQMTGAIDLANGNDSHPISVDTLESCKVDGYESRRTSHVYVSGDCFDRAPATSFEYSRDTTNQ